MKTGRDCSYDPRHTNGTGRYGERVVQETPHAGLRRFSDQVTSPVGFPAAGPRRRDLSEVVGELGYPERRKTPS